MAGLATVAGHIVKSYTHEKERREFRLDTDEIAEQAAYYGDGFFANNIFWPKEHFQRLVTLYRERFEPSAILSEPYAICGYNVFAADTEDEAQLLATSMQQSFVRLRTGQQQSALQDLIEDLIT